VRNFVPLFGKEGQGEIFGKIFGKSKANLKSPSPPLRKGEVKECEKLCSPLWQRGVRGDFWKDFLENFNLT